MKYKCKYCDFETDDSHALGGHMKKHGKHSRQPTEPPRSRTVCEICGKECQSRHGVLVHKAIAHKGERHEAVPEVPEEAIPEAFTASDIAVALLNKVVEAIKSHELLEQEVRELRPYKGWYLEVQDELKKSKEAYERLLKSYNNAIKQRNLAGVEMPSLEQLIEMSKPTKKD